MRIAVYCSARENIPEQYHNDAKEFGTWLGRNGHTLVYGGLTFSMMGDVAQATADAGGKVTGVVPQSKIEHQHPANTVSILVPDLHERKQTMEENADVFVALEGGIGTLDEVFAALASSTFSGTPRQIHLLDRDGLYAPLRQLIDNMQQQRLVNASAASLIHYHPDVKSLTKALTNLANTLSE